MIYGDEKRLQMARSILPSRRSFRKDKAAVKRAARRAVTMRLRHYDEHERLPLTDAPDLQPVIWWRRALDKLAHFQRWACRVTTAIPEGSRLSAMRGVLPEGLIGEHALLHLRRMAHFQHPAERAIDDAQRATWRARVRAVADEERPRLLEQVLRRDDARRKLAEALQAAHVTRLWPLRRGAVADLAPGRPRTQGAQPPQLVPLDPTEWRAIGPQRPPSLQPDDDGFFDQERWLLAIRAAATARATVPAGPLAPRRRATGRRGRPVLQRMKDLPNPHCHPEWLKALDQFLQSWRNTDGDLARVLRGF